MTYLFMNLFAKKIARRIKVFTKIIIPITAKTDKIDENNMAIFIRYVHRGHAYTVNTEIIDIVNNIYLTVLYIIIS